MITSSDPHRQASDAGRATCLPRVSAQGGNGAPDNGRDRAYLMPILVLLDGAILPPEGRWVQPTRRHPPESGE